MNNKHVVIAMSGGVDSSVSAALLKEQGYHVSGISLQLYDPVARDATCRTKTCCSLDDVLDAGRVYDRSAQGSGHRLETPAPCC